ncbi:hypothetical protein VTJ83DRAFT_7258 [Remersonia thermophila]|uniref:PLC-like phosphodiesterase n=1 Tax=Remersonia thermophila TaxID=72144 RepID=A0ABR4D351_9PEZI
MMASLRRIALFWAVSLAVSPALAQEETSLTTSTTADIIYLTGTVPRTTDTPPTSSKTSASTGTTDLVSKAVETDPSESTTDSLTYITGSSSPTTTGTTTGTGNSTQTSSTSTSPAPTNTRPCNGYPELCERKYSNITQVGCHNSPFVRAGSAAANQEFPVLDQLKDGVRFLQGQIQWPANGTVPHFCHTSCDLLDAGPITDWLRQVRDWVAAHPYDVVTILLGNGNYSTPDLYVPYIEESGITQFVFTPAKVPLRRDDWPTLAQLILSGQRVVMFLDYMADQNAYPWLLDEFSHMWETPFDPIDRSFPCTVQRPPDLNPDAARNDYLYLMNHNLNAEVSLLGQTILVPAVSELNVTNAADGEGSLGMAAANCRGDWGHPPNVLNVDYYNYGNYPGSVFEVAARMNNVTYERRPCCGPEQNSAGRLEMAKAALWLGIAWVIWML